MKRRPGDSRGGSFQCDGVCPHAAPRNVVSPLSARLPVQNDWGVVEGERRWVLLPEPQKQGGADAMIMLRKKHNPRVGLLKCEFGISLSKTIQWPRRTLFSPVVLLPALSVTANYLNLISK